MNQQSMWSSVVSLGVLVLATPLLDAQNAHLVAVPVKTAQNASSSDVTLPPGCPNYTGVLSAFGVPVGQEIQLEVFSDPAPAGGYSWNVYSSDPTILAAGNTTQGFIPAVFTPEGSQYSSPFSVFGIAVGETSFVIEETAPGFGFSYTPSTAWAVNPGASSSFLDANPPFNTCLTSGTGVLSTDPNVLSACGSNVYGTVTDGVTQLLLRMAAGLQGTGCYSITSTGPPDQGSITSAIVSTQAAGSYDYGFSYYQAPNGYGPNDTSSSRQIQVQFAFAPAGANTNTTVIPATLTVIRPPLLLIHGLWSSSSAWPTGVWGSGSNNPNNLVYAADYQGTNAASYSVNYPSVQNWVAYSLQQARVMGYAATQVDVAGHSMGGILTRLYAGSSQFIRNDNYNMGDIHRLVTLDTPHSGASLANLIVSLNANSTVAAIGSFLWSDFASGIVGGIAVGGAGVVNDGAICDLSENSPASQGMNGGTSLPSQVVTGIGGIAGTPSSPAAYFSPVEAALTFQLPLIHTYLFPQNVVNGFRFLQPNDQIVSLLSQQALAGGGGSYQTSYIHTTVETEQDVATKTLALLDGPSSGFLSSLPGVGSNGMGNPATVTGTTPAQDKSDYADECIGFFAPLALQPPPTEAKAATSPAGTAAQVRRARLVATPDSRVTITSPTNGQQFAPGNTVNVTVQVTGGLTLTAGWVATLLPGIGAVNGTNYTANSFQASFVIPATSVGPVNLTPSIIDNTTTPYLGVAISINVVPAAIPTSLKVQQAFTALTAVPATASIVVIGGYADGSTLNLTSVTGTTYSSSNTNVLTVNAQGAVQAIAFGTAVVTVQNSGLTAYAVYDIENPATPLAAQNLTTGFQVSQSGFQLNRNTGFYTQTVTITNNQTAPMVGPLYFIINGLPAGVNLANNGGGLTQTIGPVGSPYLRLSLPDGLTLQPGAHVSLLLQFLDPTRVNPHYTATVFRTMGTP